MAESQLLCLDNQHVNEKVPESRPEFYYSEEQRAALEELLRRGDGAFKTRLHEDNIRDFLCARELRAIRDSFQEYEPDPDGEPEAGQPDKPRAASSADSGVHSTYWPQMSDTEAPAPDLGWPACSGAYKGVTRVSVFTHPPKEPGPHVREVVRRLIQGAQKVLAIVMDLLTDLQILQDLLDAAARRGVAVYAVLEARGVPHFLDMSSRLQINAMHLRNLRVRTVSGAGLALSFGKLPGSLCSKYMLVDGEKVVFGSYSFTWTSSRLDRSVVTVMTGQIVDVFDGDFRETYAVSEPVDLHKELNISRPPPPAAAAVTPPPRAERRLRAAPVSTSRFQVSVGDSGRADLKVPPHKYHNPKYSLVFGSSLTGSLQDLSTQSVHTGRRDAEGHGDTLDRGASPSGARNSQAAAVRKPRGSFRNFLKNRAANHRAETIQEGVATPPGPAPVATEANGVAGTEPEDSLEEKPARLKPKRPQKIIQRSVSLQSIGSAETDGLKSRRWQPRKNCIQS